MLDHSFRELKLLWEGKISHDWEVTSTLASFVVSPHVKDKVHPWQFNPLCLDNYVSSFTPSKVRNISRLWKSMHGKKDK